MTGLLVGFNAGSNPTWHWYAATKEAHRVFRAFPSVRCIRNSLGLGRDGKGCAATIMTGFTQGLRI